MSRISYDVLYRLPGDFNWRFHSIASDATAALASCNDLRRNDDSVITRVARRNINNPAPQAASLPLHS